MGERAGHMKFFRSETGAGARGWFEERFDMLHRPEIVSLMSSSDFKEDAVRETVVLPMLQKLGYGEIGRHRLQRSKTLRNAFIRIGTRKVPITSIPDYTLYDGEKVLCVLDAKRPNIDLDADENVQQAYSYAIHPDIRTDHFALCNGRRLVVYNTTSRVPILDARYETFDKDWAHIERALGPRFLAMPALRRFAPDFGTALRALGFSPKVRIHLQSAGLNLFAVLDRKTYVASANISFQGIDHCATFDFHPRKLPRIIAGLPEHLRRMFVEALGRAPFQASAELAIEIDVEVTLGPITAGAYEEFVPLIIRDVTASHFQPELRFPRPTDVPPEVFKLRDHFTVSSPDSTTAAEPT